MFIFDAFSLCKKTKFGALEVIREEEFAPLKNPITDKVDNEITARDMYSKLH